MKNYHVSDLRLGKLSSNKILNKYTVRSSLLLSNLPLRSSVINVGVGSSPLNLYTTRLRNAKVSYYVVSIKMFFLRNSSVVGSQTVVIMVIT